MAYDFPIGPSVGQAYNNYVWDGEKWTLPKGVTPDRGTIYAAPFDAMAYNGMQINGSMDVSQQFGNSGVAVGAGKYIVDGWSVQSSGPQLPTAVQTSTAPAGYAYSLNVFFTPGANPSPAAGHFVFYSQYIEGYRMSRLAWGTANAQPLTIGFWAWAVRTGTYSGSVRNALNNRSYVFNFTINAASTFEYKTVTIPGDTAGTWSTDNNPSLGLAFTVMTGTTYQTAAGVWTAGNFLGSTGTLNGAAATSDSFAITGVVILPGIEAPSAARSPLIMRPYDQELITCKRYWQQVSALWQGYITVGTGVTAAANLPIAPRANPTITGQSQGASNFPNAVGTLSFSGPHFVQDNRIASGSSGNAYFFSLITADARL
jgi:hypothetical protein